MKIQSSEIALAGQHAATQHYQKSTSLRAWVGDQRPDFEGRSRNTGADRLSLSERAQSTAAQTALPKVDQEPSTKKAEGVSDNEKELALDPRSKLIMMMVEAFTGKKIKIASLDNIGTNAPQCPSVPPSATTETVNTSSASSEAPPDGYGVEYDSHESYAETEQSNFSAQGVIRTSDGKQIDFTLDLSMERSYSTQTDVNIRLGDAARQKKDPLVINLDGNAAQLTSTKFSFDIDADGQADKVSFTAPSSGFLALDKNNDGTINNGSELFGAITGDGFAELADYDQDKNGWIDENDKVFDKLKILTKDENGKDSLSGLKTNNVGALYINKVSTPFDLKGSDNASLGTVRASGIYLKENGAAGTLQQIDLTV
ncbi:conserved hypothetical protein [Gammaproteobacteria bacterium]